MITIFTASWCHKCLKLKYILEAADPPIEYTIIDVDEDPHSAVSNHIGVLPTIIFPSGRRHIGGISTFRFKELLEEEEV